MNFSKKVANNIIFGAFTALAIYRYFEKAKMLKRISKPNKFNDNLLTQKKVPTEYLLSSHESGIHFGEHANHPVGKPEYMEGHCAVIGATGSGKTSSILIPTLQKWNSFLVLVLIKGDHIPIIEERRKQGRIVLSFEPELGENNRLHYDPLFLLKKEPERIEDNIGKLAYILSPDNGNKNDIWTANFRIFFKGVLLYIYSIGGEFTDFIKIICSRSMRDIVKEINLSGCKSAIKYISKLSDMGDQQFGSIAVDANRLCELCSPAIERAFEVSESADILDWDILNHSEKPVDIVIVIPESDIQLYSKWISILLEQMFYVLLRRPERKYDGKDLPPVLLALDEFSLIGKIPGLVQGLQTLRSRGVTFFLTAQNTTAIDRVYGMDDRKLIYANCSYKLLLNLAEASDQQLFSEASGNVFVHRNGISEGSTFGVSISPDGFNLTANKNMGVGTSLVERRLIYPSAFAQLDGVVCLTPKGSFQVKKNKIFNKQKVGAENE